MYTSLLFKTVMRLAIIDNKATTKNLRANLKELDAYMVACKLDITKFHIYFDTNYTQLVARGKTVDDPIDLLFDGYMACTNKQFVKYMENKRNKYFEEQPHMKDFTHEKLMSLAAAKQDTIGDDKWGQKSPKDQRIITLKTKVDRFKGQLKLADSVTEKTPSNKDKGSGTRKKISNKEKQKRMRHGRKCLQELVTPRQRRLETRLIISVYTTWFGPFTSLVSVSLGKRKPLPSNLLQSLQLWILLLVPQMSTWMPTWKSS